MTRPNCRPIHWFPILGRLLAHLALLWPAAASAQVAATQPADPLDGTIMQLRMQGQTRQYQLAAVPNVPATQPATAPVEPPAREEGAFRVMLSGGIAPAVIHVHAQDVPLWESTPLTARYEWDFGDPRGRYNTLVGWNAAHVYERPGTYTIRLRLTEQTGRQRLLSARVVIAEQPRRRVYVSVDGNDLNDGSIDAKPVRTLTRAQRLLGREAHLLLRRGDMFPVTRSLEIRAENVIVGAYGDGARPVLKWSGPRDGGTILSVRGASARDLLIDGLCFDSIHDADTDDDGMPTAIRPQGHNIAVRDCEFRHVGDAINANGKPTGLLVQDCAAPLAGGVRGYFAWAEGSDHVYLGNAVANSTRQHCIRMAGYTRVLVAHNDLANVAAVSGDSRKGCIVMQVGSWVYAIGNRCGSGGIGFGPLGDGDGDRTAGVRTSWGVIENNRVDDSHIDVHHGAEHLAVRNNLVLLDDAGAFRVDGFNRAYARGIEDVTIAHNTAVNRGAGGTFLHVGPGATGVSLLNNLYVAPNLEPGSNRRAAVFVLGEDLSGFDAIRHNVWCLPARFDSYADGGVQYVWPKWSDPRGYRTPEEWGGMTPVEGDLFVNVELDQNFCPPADSPVARRGVPVPGVFIDLHGRPRPQGRRAAGAVEPGEPPEPVKLP